MKNAATTAKKAKRPYVKKQLRTQDELWKAIIPALWGPFLRFCLEDWADNIDYTRKPDFLDKELKRLRLRSKSKNRTVDFLMRVYMKDGTTKSFLLHIEVQGYDDPEFRQRLFQYYYRISDLLGEDIETLVIMIDDAPDWRPNEYIKEFGQTKVHFICRMFKLLDNPPPYTGKENNPFAVVFEVAWYGLKKNMLKNDDDLHTLRFRLIRRLIEIGIDGDIIHHVLDFVNIYLPFKNKEKESTFDREIDSIINQGDNMEAITMRDIRDRIIREDERRIAKKEINRERRIAKKAEERRQALEVQRQEEARMRQEEARMRQAAEQSIEILIRKLHAQGASVESIAEAMSKPVAFVQNIVDEKQ